MVSGGALCCLYWIWIKFGWTLCIVKLVENLFSIYQNSLSRLLVMSVNEATRIVLVSTYFGHFSNYLFAHVLTY